MRIKFLKQRIVAFPKSAILLLVFIFSAALYAVENPEFWAERNKDGHKRNANAKAINGNLRVRWTHNLDAFRSATKTGTGAFGGYGITYSQRSANFSVRDGQILTIIPPNEAPAGVSTNKDYAVFGMYSLSDGRLLHAARSTHPFQTPRSGDFSDTCPGLLIQSWNSDGNVYLANGGDTCMYTQFNPWTGEIPFGRDYLWSDRAIDSDGYFVMSDSNPRTVVEGAKSKGGGYHEYPGLRTLEVDIQDRQLAKGSRFCAPFLLEGNAAFTFGMDTTSSINTSQVTRWDIQENPFSVPNSGSHGDGVGTWTFTHPELYVCGLIPGSAKFLPICQAENGGVYFYGSKGTSLNNQNFTQGMFLSGVRADGTFDGDINVNFNPMTDTSITPVLLQQNLAPQIASRGNYVVVFQPYQKDPYPTGAFVNGHIFCFNISTHTLAWRYDFPTGYFQTATTVWNQLGDNMEEVQMVIAGDEVFLVDPRVESGTYKLQLQVNRFSLSNGTRTTSLLTPLFNGQPLVVGNGTITDLVKIKELAAVDGTLICLIDHGFTDASLAPGSYLNPLHQALVVIEGDATVPADYPPVAMISAPITGYTSEPTLSEFPMPPTNEFPANVPITFSSTGSNDPDGGSIMAYEWNFGDGTTSAVANPVHTYAVTGAPLSAVDQTVTLKVQDNEGNWSKPVSRVLSIRNKGTIQKTVKTATEDTYVDFAASQINKNFGTLTSMLVLPPGSAGTPRRSYVKFDVTGVDLTHLVSAKFRVRAITPTGDYDNFFRLFGTADSWTETGLKASNVPALGEGLVDGTLYANNPILSYKGFVDNSNVFYPPGSYFPFISDAGWLEFPVTEYVRSNGSDGKVSFAMGLADLGKTGLTLGTREGGYPAELVLETGTPFYAAPSFTTQPASSINLDNLFTANLTALASSPLGESALTYHWHLVSAPAGGFATFSDNHTNIGKATTVFMTANIFGTYTMRCVVSDDSQDVQSNLTTITITNLNNTAPTISSIANQTTDEDIAITINFTIGDAESAASTLVLTKSSSNTTLVPNTAANLLLGGTGANRTLTITPIPELNGSSTITLTVSDGLLTTTASFVLTVNPVNDDPTISQVPPQAIPMNGATPVLSFTVDDLETPPELLTLSASSSNKTVVPNANIVFGGSGANRTVKVTPAPNQKTPILGDPINGFYDEGLTITITVSDGQGGISSTPLWMTVGSNSNPTISSIPDQTTKTGTATPAISFTIGDVETPAGNLTLSASSSVQSFLSNNKIVLGGSGANRTVTLTPAAGQTGTTTVTVKVFDDDGYEASTSFLLTISSEGTDHAPVVAGQSVVTDINTPVNITLNGSDTDGDALTYLIINSPSYGTLSGSGAARTYTPNPNYTGPDSFKFLANDGKVNSDPSAPAKVFITVKSGGGSNTAPVANAQSVTTSEDTGKTITLDGSDADGDTLTYSIVGNPAHGSLSGSGNSRTYTPSSNYNGSDSFTFKVNDGKADSNTATVSITVTAVNDVPVATAQSVTTDEDTAKAITLTGSDVESFSLTYTVVTQPAHGLLTGTAPSLTYTPDANYNGTDNFTFKVNDGTVDSTAATVSITINAVNDVPVANAQSVTTNEDTAKVITLVGTDVDGDTLTYSIVGNPTHGTLSGSGASRTYTPDANYNGADSFTFRVNDGSANSNTATVSITVSAENDLPAAAAQSVSLVQDTNMAITLSATDVDGDSLTYTTVSSPSHGALTGTVPNLTYTPTAGYIGSDSFTFKANDGVGDSNTATISITVTKINHAPVADAQSVTTNEDTAKGVTLTGSDVDGDTLTFSVIDSPTHGTLSGTSPNLTYTPEANYNGSDSFTFKANDSQSNNNLSPLTTISITVNAVNDLPVANAQSITTNEDTAKPITLSGSDVESFSLTYTVVTSPAHGLLTGSAPNVTYTPDANYNGLDSFTFKVNDGTADSSPATVSITVNTVNDTPVANAQSITTNEDTAQAIALTATDVDGDTLTYSIVSNPTHGSLSGNGSNRTYTPDANYNGTDTFTFRVNDGSVNSNTAAIAITVTAVNDAPVALAQSVSLEQDTNTVITLSAMDVEGDTLTYSVVGNPSHGTLTGTAPSLTYTPTAGYIGTDSFTFKSNDGAADSNIATISITVTKINHAPVADAQSVTTNEDASTGVTLTGSDVDGDSITYTVTSNPAHGVLSGTAPNLTYTPIVDYNGSDSFAFRVNDGALNSAVATVSITVNAVNDVPVATAQSVTTNEDTAQTITLAGTDIEGSTLSYTIATQPSHGTLNGTVPSLVYTPDANYNGSDSFTFKVNDGSLDSAAATVSITVNAVNDIPVADAQSIITDEDTAKTITLTGSDIENSSLTYVVVNNPSHGTLSGTVPNLTYTPASNYNSSDSFTFKVNDGTADSSLATVSITVNAVNDIPVANAQSVTMDEDTVQAIALTGSDAESFSLTYTVLTTPAYGLLTGTAPNLTYTPDPDYNGLDSFTFKVNDGTADSLSATVSITVKPANDTPTIASISNQTTDEDTETVAIAFTVDDIDTLLDSLTLSASSSDTTLVPVSNIAFGGSGANRTVKVLPGANQNSGVALNKTATITVTVSDGPSTASSSFDLTVKPVNDAPVAVDQNIGTAKNEAKKVMLGATDADNDTPTYTVETNPSHGSLSGTAPDLTYTPNTDYVGSDSFTFKANDGTVDGNTATISIAVSELPFITEQPAAQKVKSGEKATFSVVASGTGPLSYQWQKDGKAIDGATADSYTTPEATIQDDGAQFNVVVSNSFGTVNSDKAMLFVESGSSGGGGSDAVTVINNPGSGSFVGSPDSVSGGLSANPLGGGVALNQNTPGLSGFPGGFGGRGFNNTSPFSPSRRLGSTDSFLASDVIHTTPSSFPNYSEGGEAPLSAGSNPAPWVKRNEASSTTFVPSQIYPVGDINADTHVGNPVTIQSATPSYSYGTLGGAMAATAGLMILFSESVRNVLGLSDAFSMGSVIQQTSDFANRLFR